MLFFAAATAVLGVLTYYFLRSEDNEPSRDSRTKGTAHRDRESSRRTSAENESPQIHRQKVASAAQEASRRARARAEALLENGKEEKLAWDSYFLSESIREMFSRSEFFERGRRFSSFRTALEAAEDARDRLLDNQREAAHRKKMNGTKGASYNADRYVRNAVESELVIAWCAGGLIGKSRPESAREAFYVTVSAEDVQDWKRFDQLLRKERERRMANAEASGHHGV